MADRSLARGSSRLAHGWLLMNSAAAPRRLVLEFIRPAVRAVPFAMARRLGCCRISLQARVDSTVTSEWTRTGDGLQVCVVISGLEEHDAAMELLLCLGQALWERLSGGELRAYWTVLEDEIRAGITGEIDEQALEEKRSLLAGPSGPGGWDRFGPYGRASFAGTAAEYVHCLWHDVTVRTGPDHLPASPLRRRLELLARCFPPDRGYRLFRVRP